MIPAAPPDPPPCPPQLVWEEGDLLTSGVSEGTFLLPAVHQASCTHLLVQDVDATGEQWAVETAVAPVLLVVKAWKHKGLIHATRKLHSKVCRSHECLAGKVWTSAEIVLAEEAEALRLHS